MVIGSSWASADMRHLHARYGTDDRQPALPLPAGEPLARRRLQLERENRELRRANEILKAASADVARERDPRLPKP